VKLANWTSAERRHDHVCVGSGVNRDSTQSALQQGDAPLLRVAAEARRQCTDRNCRRTRFTLIGSRDVLLCQPVSSSNLVARPATDYVLWCLLCNCDISTLILSFRPRPMVSFLAVDFWTIQWPGQRFLPNIWSNCNLIVKAYYLTETRSVFEIFPLHILHFDA